MGEEHGVDSAPSILYHRPELIKIKEQFDDEIALLSNGSKHEMEKIRGGTVTDYLSLIKLRLSQNKPKDNGNN